MSSTWTSMVLQFKAILRSLDAERLYVEWYELFKLTFQHPYILTLSMCQLKNKSLWNGILVLFSFRRPLLITKPIWKRGIASLKMLFHTVSTSFNDDKSFVRCGVWAVELGVGDMHSFRGSAAIQRTAPLFHGFLSFVSFWSTSSSKCVLHLVDKVSLFLSASLCRCAERALFVFDLWPHAKQGLLDQVCPTQMAYWAKTYVAILNRAAHSMTYWGPHIEWLTLILAQEI